MNKEQFENERDYCAVMALIKDMRAKGVIGEEAFARLRRNAIEQYKPAVSCLRDEGAEA